jgi:16S rRNA (cytosine967-C5)-methyltransferase
MKRPSPARRAAFDALMRIDRDGAFSSAALPAVELHLDPIDRPLCHEIVMTVLRHKLHIDALIDEFSGKKSIDLEVRIAARIGLAQLIHLDRVAQYSAIDESVELVAYANKRSAKGFVNALLRRAQSKGLSVTFSDEIERVSIETSHPRWLIEKWAADLGLERAKVIAESNNVKGRPAFRITAKGLDSDYQPPEGVEASTIVRNCYIVDAASEKLRQDAAEGLIAFMDEGSQMVAVALGVQNGDIALDVCAAPGGKAAILQAGASIVIAGDIYGHRVRTMSRLLKLQGLGSLPIVQFDAAAGIPTADQMFDRILVDAPCSGTGTLRHNPEIKYSLTRDDIDELSDKQFKILANAFEMLRPGGRLIYSTCSFESEEGEEVVERLLKENAEVEVRDVGLPAKFAVAVGQARSLPDRDDMDGFFIAALGRKS